MKARCGKSESKRGKAFTEKSLCQHQRDCDKCVELMKLDGTYQEEYHIPYGDISHNPANDVVTSDMTDGVYWAIKGGW